MTIRWVRFTALVASTLVGAVNAAQISEYPLYEPSTAVRRGYTAEDLRNAEVRGLLGKRIGTVDDLIIGARSPAAAHRCCS